MENPDVTIFVFCDKWKITDDFNPPILVCVSPLSVLNVYSNVGFYWLWHKLLYKTDKLEGEKW